MGYNQMWGMRSTGRIRDCLSEEILLARPLRSQTQGDLTALLIEVRDLLKQRCQCRFKASSLMDKKPLAVRSPLFFQKLLINSASFTSLPDAVDPLYEADRHAKTQLKKQVRGVRPLERAGDLRSDSEAEAIRGYCLAVRSAMTDDGRAPLEASGLILQDRLTQISESIARVEQKKSFPQL